MWQGVLGHDRVVDQFRRALQRGRLASGFLFVGPSGIGKRLFARRLAQALLCRTAGAAALAPCGVCESCIQAAAGSHPDIIEVAKPADRSFIPLELLIGDKEHRGRQGLCYELSLRPFFGRRKVAVIDDADALNAEGANSLLKTLEEPPPGAVLILISASPARQLPTIRSRCQMVHFFPLSPEEVQSILLDRGLVDDKSTAERIAAFCEGSVERALELNDPRIWEFRRSWADGLSEARIDSVEWAGRIGQFVDAAGKEAAARRGCLRQVIGFASDYYRGVLRAAHETTSLPAAGDPDRHWQAAVAKGVAEARAAFGDAWIDKTARRLDLCLAAREALERNANQTTLIEAWLDSLADC